jgi:hypothetical protein
MNVGHVETNGVLIAFTDGTRLFLGGSASQDVMVVNTTVASNVFSL